MDKDKMLDFLQEIKDYREAKAYKAQYNPKENVSFEAIKIKYQLDKN